MNEIIFSNNSMPTVSGCNFRIATEPFTHINRIIDFHVMIFVTEGIMYVTEDKVDYEIHPGELLFLKSGLHHLGKKITLKGTKWHFVHFFLDAPNSLPSFSPSDTMMSQFEPVLYHTQVPKKITNLAASKLEEDIKSFTEYYHSDDRMKHWNINAKFFQLLTKISFYGETITPFSSLSDKISEYLYSLANEPFSASGLEDQFYLSYKHMAAVFKKEKQITMQQYHTQVRMNKACNLLKSTSMPISKISEVLGFTDMLYFSRCFHQFSGVSPTEYRKLQITLY